jgi:hypothetical protein
MGLAAPLCNRAKTPALNELLKAAVSARRFLGPAIVANKRGPGQA